MMLDRCQYLLRFTDVKRKLEGKIRRKSTEDLCYVLEAQQHRLAKVSSAIHASVFRLFQYYYC